MNTNSILAYLALVVGIIYAVILLRKGIKKGRIQGYGKFGQMAAGEGAVFFLAAIGFSDFLLNIPLFSKLKWVKDDMVPETLMASDVVPGAIIAFYYLQNAKEIGMEMLIPAMIATGLGCFIGSHFLLKANAEKMRYIMFYALIFSMIAFIVRLILTNGQASELTTLPAGKIVISVIVLFILGFMNAFGVPMKAPTAAMFSILGLSPIMTLTIMLTMGMVSPAMGCIKIVKSDHYNQRVSVAAVIFGTVGAILGCMLAISMDQLTLTIIMLLIIGISIVDTGSKIKKSKAEKNI